MAKENMTGSATDFKPIYVSRGLESIITRNRKSTEQTSGLWTICTKKGEKGKEGEEESMKIDESSEWAFITQVFKLQGTVWIDIYPQLLFAWAMCFVASLTYWLNDNPTNWLPDDVKSMHGTVGTLIAFLMAFRTSQSYTNYVEGRKILGGICNNLREMAMTTYTFRANLTGAEGEEVCRIRRNIRRQINVLYAVIRQHVREYEEGFDDKRIEWDKQSKSFKPHEFEGGGALQEDEKKSGCWIYDPVKPCVSHLIHESEFKTLNKLPSSMRPARIEVELNSLAHALSDHLEEPGFFLQAFSRNAEETMNLFKSAYRIVETPVPMPYRHVLYFLTFCYVFVTPWVYSEPTKTGDCKNDDHDDCKDGEAAWGNGWAASTLICIAYYGVMELAAALQNPFGWDAIDLDLEQFGKRVHNETKCIAEAATSNHGVLDAYDYLDPYYTKSSGSSGIGESQNPLADATALQVGGGEAPMS